MGNAPLPSPFPFPLKKPQESSATGGHNQKSRDEVDICQWGASSFAYQILSLFFAILFWFRWRRWRRLVEMDDIKFNLISL